jgi:DNA-binding GntR family transcriptional regulator
MTESLAERAYQEVRAAIVDGRLVPGEPILELDLGARLRMSRTPIREALLHLELEGYLVRDDASRLVVHRLSAEEVAQLFMVRELLEGEAVRLAAARISEAELARLDELVLADRSALRRRRFDELHALNEQIHSVFMEASRNRTLIDLLGNLRGRIYGLDAFAVGSLADQSRVVDEHAALVEHLRDGDEQAAVALLEAHLDRAREVFLRDLGQGDAR